MSHGKNKPKWTQTRVIIELQTLHSNNVRITQKYLRSHRADLEGAINRKFGNSLNAALIASGISITRRRDRSTRLYIKSTVLTVGKARCVAWLSETGCRQTNTGSWMLALETPEEELAKLIVADFAGAYNYRAMIRKRSRGTFAVQICSKTIVEEMLFFAQKERVLSGRYKINLTEGFLEQLNKRKTIVFLQRLYDCEGSVTLDGRCIHISMTTISDQMMKHVSSMLSHLGIENSLIKDESNHKLHPVRSIAWKVRINKNESVCKFSDVIGFGLPRKRERLLTLIKLRKSTRCS